MAMWTNCPQEFPQLWWDEPHINVYNMVIIANWINSNLILSTQVVLSFFSIGQGGCCPLSAQCRTRGLWKTELPSSKAQQHWTKAWCSHGSSHNTRVRPRIIALSKKCFVYIPRVTLNFYVAEPCVHLIIIISNIMVGIYSLVILIICALISTSSQIALLICVRHICNYCVCMYTFHQMTAIYSHNFHNLQVQKSPFKAN